MTSENVPTITLHPSELLRQVSASMNGRHEDITVNLPVQTTWKASLSAVSAALGDVDEPIHLFPQRRSTSRRVLREVALETVRLWDSEPSSPGYPIRSSVDIKTLGIPKRASPSVRQVLKENIKSWPDNLPEPYLLRLNAGLCERTLATVSGRMTLSGIDAGLRDPEFVLESDDFFWDTAAHTSIIVEDLLPTGFREYLNSPQNDPYRSGSQIRIQVSAFIGFSNHHLEINTIFIVVPRSVVPNSRIGIILGQKLLIDRLKYRSIPKCLLVAKEERDIPEGIWGDLILEEYLDTDVDGANSGEEEEEKEVTNTTRDIDEGRQEGLEVKGKAKREDELWEE
ncbi:MAG: uracil DNA glycosylase [Geoglossum simile]|nr:MAG: uracil DNA glycosylase [Geoglossum simile]